MPEQKDTDVLMVSLLQFSQVSTVRLDLSDLIFSVLWWPTRA